MLIKAWHRGTYTLKHHSVAQSSDTNMRLPILHFLLCVAVDAGALRLGVPSIRGSQRFIPDPAVGLHVQVPTTSLQPMEPRQTTHTQPPAAAGHERRGDGIRSVEGVAAAQKLANQSTALHAVTGDKPRGRGREQGEEQEGHVSFPPWVHWAALCTFATIVMMCCIWSSTVLLSTYRDFRAVKQSESSGGESESNRTYYTYLNYRFAYWFVWTDGSTTIVMVFVSIACLCLAGITYGALTGTNLWTSLWKSFVWLVAPDAGAGEFSHVGAGVGAVTSIFGLVIFALLLTLLQDSFTSYLDHIRQGRQQVLETGHTLLIGVTDSTLPMLAEMCKAHEPTGGTVICILSHRISKTDMEEKIMDLDLDLAGSKIIVAEGHPYSDTSLWLVSAASTASIVIIPDREQAKETRDAFVLRSLVGLRGKGWPMNGRILAICSLPRNQPLLQKMGGKETDIVMLDLFLARLMVQCSSHPGLGILVQQTFGFEGSEFYVEASPKALEGKTFGDASRFYPSAVLCGILSDSDCTDSLSDFRSLQCTLCP